MRIDLVSLFNVAIACAFLRPAAHRFKALKRFCFDVKDLVEYDRLVAALDGHWKSSEHRNLWYRNRSVRLIRQN